MYIIYGKWLSSWRKTLWKSSQSIGAAMRILLGEFIPSKYTWTLNISKLNNKTKLQLNIKKRLSCLVQTVWMWLDVISLTAKQLMSESHKWRNMNEAADTSQLTKCSICLHSVILTSVLLSYILNETMYLIAYSQFFFQTREDISHCNFSWRV